MPQPWWLVQTEDPPLSLNPQLAQRSLSAGDGGDVSWHHTAAAIVTESLGCYHNEDMT